MGTEALSGLQSGRVVKLTIHLQLLPKHIFANLKQLGITLTKMYWLLGRKSKLSTSNKLDLRNTALGYGFH
jgi:hypothetical protein